MAQTKKEGSKGIPGKKPTEIPIAKGSNSDETSFLRKGKSISRK